MSPSEVWEAMVADGHPLPPFVALDMVMESAVCERAEAVRLLHEAAAEWMEGVTDGHYKPFGPPEYIKEGAVCRCEDWIAGYTGGLGGTTDYVTTLEKVVAVLQELTSGVPA